MDVYTLMLVIRELFVFLMFCLLVVAGALLGRREKSDPNHAIDSRSAH
jgi:hypothetical protein